jgi:CheY-like chemotaxis protein
MPYVVLATGQESLWLEVSTFLLAPEIKLKRAWNASELIDLIKVEFPTVLFMDVNLPKQSGYEICEQLKSDERTASIQVILLVKKEEFNREKSKQARADFTLAAPFGENDYNTILNIVKLLSGTLVERHAEIMSVGSRIVIDLMSHRASNILFNELLGHLKPNEIAGADPAEKEKSMLESFKKNFFQIVKHAKFLRSLTNHIIEELPELLWIELVDSLIQFRVFEANDFGKFELIRIGNSVYVTFQPSKALVVGSMPTIRYRSDTITSAAQEACAEEFHSLFERFAKDPQKSPAIENSDLVAVLSRLLIRFGQLDEVNGIEVWSPERLGIPSNWLASQGRALSVFAITSYVIEFSTRLRSGDSIDIPTIGRFKISASNVIFEASIQFLKLLRANLPASMSAHG